ncbi:SRPBCC family protein [Tsukamurella asaccharolytica]|uniref:SRPBCC family protein n=1 Tax=Tsukamurella asaccharolytica TaxID=2592067 RepID=A0A5C5R7W9_9ACTN|nr:SRPBCC family protein [Tsukamurella asaccharolytica]TWS18712.1 SRPBCC family protein [Tsukamurella asaccharolytica]
MTTIHHTASASVPLSTVFAHVADYRTVPKWFFGISRFVPQGEQDYGLGATYDAAVKIGPKEIGSVVRVTEFEEDRLITLTSIAGFTTASRWTFTALDDATTELAVEFTYELPGGLAGRALGMIIEPFAIQAVKASESALRRDLEAARA